ncbi:MAG: hypothetical protein Q9169_004632 [Polycauliona sp. 2 TL-2023]
MRYRDLSINQEPEWRDVSRHEHNDTGSKTHIKSRQYSSFQQNRSSIDRVDLRERWRCPRAKLLQSLQRLQGGRLVQQRCDKIWRGKGFACFLLAGYDFRNPAAGNPVIVIRSPSPCVGCRGPIVETANHHSSFPASDLRSSATIHPPIPYWASIGLTSVDNPEPVCSM